MEPVCGAANEFDRIGHVLLRRPQEAFVDAAAVRRQWRELNYLSPPDVTGAAREFERFVEVIAATGARIDFLTADSRLSLDAIYVRDALVTAPDGIILGNMGKAARRAEPALCAAALRDLEVPVAGAIVGDGLLEGGDVVWLDAGNVLWARVTVPTLRASASCAACWEARSPCTRWHCRTGGVRQTSFT